MKQCFGYIRVSTVKQGEGVSLEAQREAICAFAHHSDLKIVKWFEEQETAAKSGRPVFDKMVQDLKHGKADGLVIHRIDRSSRNLKDWATISDLSDAGVSVHFASESLDFQSRGGRLAADIQAVVAADYIRNLSIEARKGIRGRLKQGVYPFPAPVGYLDTGSGKPKALDPIRAPLVKLLFRLYLSGNHSISSLQVEMGKRGLASKFGKPLSRRSIENILGNSFYCGLVKNGRTGECFPGIHEPLISARQFQRIQNIKAGKHIKRRTKHTQTFRRLINCANCGRVLSPEIQKGRTYYRCHSKGCNIATLRADRLEDAVIKSLESLQLHKQKVDLLNRRKADMVSSKNREEILKAIDLKIAGIEDRLSRLEDLLIDGTIGKEQYQKRHEAFHLEKQNAQEERDEVAKRAATDEDRQKFFELIKTVVSLYISADSHERRTIVEICFSNRSWDGKKLQLEPSNLFCDPKNNQCVPYGGPIRDTFRTFIEIFGRDKALPKPKNSH